MENIRAHGKHYKLGSCCERSIKLGPGIHGTPEKIFSVLATKSERGSLDRIDFTLLSLYCSWSYQ